MHHKSGFEIFHISCYQFVIIFHSRKYHCSEKEVTDRNVKELTVATVAGVFTKIIASKRISSTQIVTQIDSVKCTRGGANTFTVVF